MSEFFTKIVLLFFITAATLIVLNWIGCRTRNRRVFFQGVMAILMSLSIYAFDLFRTRYGIADYLQQQVETRECLIDDKKNLKLITTENTEFYIKSGVLRRASFDSSPEYLRSVCDHKTLVIWLNPEKEISGMYNKNESIVPVEIGLAADNAEFDFLPGILFFAPCGLVLILLSLVYAPPGVETDLITGKSRPRIYR